MRSETVKRVQEKYDKRAFEYLILYDNKVIDIDTQRKIKVKLFLSDISQVSELFIRLGFWIKYIDDDCKIYKVYRMDYLK